MIPTFVKSILCAQHTQRAVAVGGYLCLLLFGILLRPPSAHAGTIIRSPSHLGLNRGLVGCWNFDGSYTKVPDCSGNGNTGTLTNGPTRVQGKVGQGMSFDGVNDYVDLPTSYTHTFPFSFSVWVYPTSYALWRNIFTKRDAFSNDQMVWQFNLDFPDGSVELWHGTTGSEFNYTPPLNDWTYLSVTSDGTVDILYVNGKFQEQINNATALGTDTAACVQIGNLNCTTADEGFAGRIDDLRAYNRILSATDVQRLYRIGLGSTVNSASGNDSFDKGLVGHWTFDGPDISGTRAKDRSGFNNHGTLTNGPAPARGKVGQALSFDGVNDEVDVGSGASIGNLATKTISAWIYPRTQGGSDFGTVIFANNGYYIQLCSNSGECPGTDSPTFVFLQFATNQGEWYAPNGTIQLNQWQHIAVTYTCGLGNVPTFYYNGRQITATESQAMSGSVGCDDSGTAKQIGRDTPIGGTSGFDGLIDDFRLYNRALSAAEINRLYNSTQSKFNSSQTDKLTQGLVGHWTFDGPDISGTRAKDKSGNENHGTITGATKARGKVGQGLDFRGSGTSDRVAVTHSATLVPTSITISAWAKTEGGSGSFRTIAIKNLNTGCGYSYVFQLENANNSLHFSYCDSGGATNDYESNTPQQFLNTWTHYAFTYAFGSSGSAKMYVNGVLVPGTWSGGGGNPGDDSMQSGAGLQMCLGSSDCAGAETWDGLIDEVRIYNRALSAPEVQKLYNMGR